jgi:hypothetical protein
MLSFSLLLACSPGAIGLGGGGDTADVPDDSPPPDEEDEENVGAVCEELEILHDGPDVPSVGDTWSLVLKCDGVPLTGAVRFFFVPADFVTWDGHRVTFQYAGDAVLTGQAGTRRTTLDVSVTP